MKKMVLTSKSLNLMIAFKLCSTADKIIAWQKINQLRKNTLAFIHNLMIYKQL